MAAWQCRGFGAGALAAALLVSSVASAAEGKSPALGEAIQMLADVTLIDGQCQNVGVVFGIAFRESESRGIKLGDIMPGGKLRPLFDMAYSHRIEISSHEEICHEVLQAYMAAFPGMIEPR